jgi:uncharacterized protein (TIGR02646 family)
MRPVSRGDCPSDAGRPRIFKDYDEAREELITRLGAYCSYCEMRHPTLAVEHIRSKSQHAALRISWNNFLLACTSCNSIKGHRKLRLRDYYWPDRDNTARAFTYLPGGKISLAQGLTKGQQESAKRTMELTGFHRDPSTDPPASEKDRRWIERLQAWQVATRTRKLLEDNDSQEARDLAMNTAVCQGFWSVWMSVFHDDESMRCRLIVEFSGTAQDCFRLDRARRRPGGSL